MQEGFPLATLNSGSVEVAFPREAAIKALESLTGLRVAVLGGDVLRQTNHQLQYVYANWYCSKQDDEAADAFVKRSQQYALSYVSNFRPASNYEPLFVFVLQQIEE